MNSARNVLVQFVPQIVKYTREAIIVFRLYGRFYFLYAVDSQVGVIAQC